MAPASPDLSVLVDAGSLPAATAGSVEEAGRRALQEEGVEHATLSIALLPDEEIQALNRRHLGHDHPTDVISFGLWDEGEPVVGDVYIGSDQATRQAREEGVPLDEELVRLTVHGVLHVLGWDHPDAPEERADSPMYRRQEALVDLILRRR